MTLEATPNWPKENVTAPGSRYMKGRLTFILSPTETASSKETAVNQEDHPFQHSLLPPTQSRHHRPPLRQSSVLSSSTSSTSHSKMSSSRSGSGGNNDDDWKNVSDPQERRRVQNRNAQRRHRKCSQPIPSEDSHHMLKWGLRAFCLLGDASPSFLTLTTRSFRANILA